MPAEARPARGGALVVAVCAAATGLVGWTVIAGLRVVPPFELPSPAAVARAWWRLLWDGVLVRNAGETVLEALLGFGLALAVAILLAYPVARSRLVGAVVSPYIVAAQAMPVLAFAPLLTMWFGIGLLSRTLICAVLVVFPVLVSMAVGLRQVDKELREAAAIAGSGRWYTFWRVELPLAAPSMFAGMKLGLTLSFTGAIVAEFVASSSGLGYMLMLAISNYDAPMLFSAALSIVMLSLLGYGTVSGVEHMALRKLQDDR